MKTVLKIILVSSILCACSNSANKSKPTPDSSSAVLDSGLDGKSSPGSALAPEDPELETRRQLSVAILSSKREINELESDISDSLTKEGLSTERRVLYRKTINQLEASTDLLNKQLEQIMVADLQANREKLTGLVAKMKGSQKELQTMIGKLDKITGYLQIATNLIQSLSPIKPVIAKPATKAS